MAHCSHSCDHSVGAADSQVLYTTGIHTTLHCSNTIHTAFVPLSQPKKALLGPKGLLIENSTNAQELF